MSSVYIDLPLTALFTDPSGKTVTYTLDTLSRRTKETLPNGLETTYGYDDISRLSSLLTKNSLQTTIDGYEYEYDRVGNRTAMITPEGVHSYSDDSLYQLTGATHPDQQPENYTYDAVGNRNPLGYQHSAWNQILEDESFTYTYDDNGNRRSRTAKNGSLMDVYTWNVENKLVKFERYDSPAATIAVTTAMYTYDALGRRIGKDVNGTTTVYVYDGIHIIAERNGQGAVTTSYVHGVGIDEPVSMSRGSATYYYHRDALGSIATLTDATGAVVQEYQYDSFGNIVYTQNPAFIQPFTFTGREYDPESGLYHYRFRNYDSQTGTFISIDPLSFEGGDVNLFRYVQNNTVNYVDPEGFISGRRNQDRTPRFKNRDTHQAFENVKRILKPHRFGGIGCLVTHVYVRNMHVGHRKNSLE